MVHLFVYLYDSVWLHWTKSYTLFLSYTHTHTHTRAQTIYLRRKSVLTSKFTVCVIRQATHMTWEFILVQIPGSATDEMTVTQVWGIIVGKVEIVGHKLFLDTFFPSPNLCCYLKNREAAIRPYHMTSDTWSWKWNGMTFRPDSGETRLHQPVKQNPAVLITVVADATALNI